MRMVFIRFRVNGKEDRARKRVKLKKTKGSFFPFKFLSLRMYIIHLYINIHKERKEKNWRILNGASMVSVVVVSLLSLNQSRNPMANAQVFLTFSSRGVRKIGT